MTERPTDIDMHLVRTAADCGDFLQWLDEELDARSVLAIDTETTGGHWYNEHMFVRLWQIGTATEGYAIPVEWWGAVIAEAMYRIASRGAQVVMQNAKYDMHAMEVMRWTLPDWSNVHDTELLLRLRRSDLRAALKGKQVAELLGTWVYDGRTVLQDRAKELGLSIKGGEYWRLMPVDDPAYWAYGVLDTCLTRRVFDAVQDVRSDFAMPYERERRYQAIMYRAENRGIRVDEAYTRRLNAELLAEAERELHFLQSQGLENPLSNTQVLALLEEDFGFVPWEFTETGQPSINKDVLAVLAEASGLQAEVVVSLVNYKRARKWQQTYTQHFLDHADRNGFVHPSIRTMGARTGRSSITDPPLQTLPSGDPMIRRCMLPPEKFVWVSIDYSNQEPRTLAHYGQSPELIRYFTEGDGRGSIHDFVAEQMFGPGYSKVQRAIAKQFGLSRSYGAGPDKMAQASGLPLHEVTPLVDPYDKLMGLAGLNAAIEEVAMSRLPNPYVLTAGGRRVYADPGTDKIYTLTNFLMQGSGADMLKDAVIRLDDAGLADFIMVPVHDEVTFAFPKEEQHLIDEAAKLMEDDSYLVPMPVDVEGPARSWGHIYDPAMA